MVRAVLGGIDTYEEDSDSGSPRGTVTRDTRRVERTLIVREEEDGYPSQDAINALVDECFPLYSAPGQFPVSGSYLYVESLDFEPFGATSGTVDEIGAYAAWKAKIVYTPLPYSVPSEGAPENVLDLLELSWQGGGEYMTMPGSSMYWNAETKPAGDEIPAAKRILYVQHAHTRHHLTQSQIPYTAMKAIAGKVNKDNFASNHPIFPGIKAETLLFESFNIGFRYASNGQTDYRLTYNFKERTETYKTVQITWNHLWRRPHKNAGGTDVPGGFVKIFHDPATGGAAQTRPMYETATLAEFDAIFQIDTGT